MRRPGPGPADQSSSASGVSSGRAAMGGRHRQPAAVDQRAGEGEVAASDSVASRNRREASNLGVMKSVLRVDLRMFSVEAARRSLQ
jgi:hypothetical protein